MSNATGISRGLPPVADKNARVLILGSLASVRSIEQQQYYAFPTNAFWKIMSGLFGGSYDDDYAERIARVKKNGVALWDSLAAAARQGSQDANIEAATARPNDFAAFFAEHRNIQLIAFNGAASQNYFQRFVVRPAAVALPEVDFLLMPSTSALNAGMTEQQKLNKWSAIREYL